MQKAVLSTEVTLLSADSFSPEPELLLSPANAQEDQPLSTLEGSQADCSYAV